jgi:hypothetical protein
MLEAPKNGWQGDCPLLFCHIANQVTTKMLIVMQAPVTSFQLANIQQYEDFHWDLLRFDSVSSNVMCCSSGTRCPPAAAYGIVHVNTVPNCAKSCNKLECGTGDSGSEIMWGGIGSRGHLVQHFQNV